MPSFTFKVSDSQKAEYLWTLLNPNYTEDNGWIIDYVVCDIYDDYAIAYNYAEGTYERVYYTKDDATDSVSIERRERCYILDVSETEKKALDTLRVLNGDTYELVDEKFASIDGLNQKISENDSKIEELNTTIATLTVERDEAINQKDVVETELAATNESFAATKSALEVITSERDELASYKKSAEDNEKKAVIADYAGIVSAEIIEKFIAELDKYTASELDMMLTYEQKKAHPEFFVQGAKPAYVPKEEGKKGGIEEILARYENK